MSEASEELVVLAGSITVLRNVGAGMAYVDAFRGEPVGDIDDETRIRLLATGDIGYAATAPEPDPEVMPDGPIPALLAWVGDDLDRAQLALDVEQEKGDGARKGIVDPLTELLTRPGN